jgi:hypothetical protein
LIVLASVVGALPTEGGGDARIRFGDAEVFIESLLSGVWHRPAAEATAGDAIERLAGRDALAGLGPCLVKLGLLSASGPASLGVFVILGPTRFARDACVKWRPRGVGDGDGETCGFAVLLGVIVLGVAA